MSGSPRGRLVALCFRLVAEGKVAALGDLYDATAIDLFGYIKSIVGSTADAEDVFQEVFAKLAARGAKLARVEKPLAYLFTVARNEALNFISKRAARRSAGEETMLFMEPAAPAGQSPVLTAAEASAALARLPVEQREAIVLKIYEGFTFVEIGEITGVSPNTAASRFRYGLEKLAGPLKKKVEEK